MTSKTWARQRGEALLREHGLAEQGWTIGFDKARTRHGVCDYEALTIRLSEVRLPHQPESDVEQTLFHEVAHALVGHEYRRTRRGWVSVHHGPKWLAQARALGYTGGTTGRSTAEGREAAAALAKWQGTCGGCGRVGWPQHRLGSVMKRGGYRHPACGGTITWKATR